MKKVNIREALLDMDKQTYCQYDLYTLYEACNLQECDKKEIAKMISDDKSPEDIYDKLVDKFSDSVTTTDDDDISDVKESFGDDLIDSQYQDDISDGHWSWDYDDDELANIYGGDTKYDNHPDGIEESTKKLNLKEDYGNLPEGYDWDDGTSDTAYLEYNRNTHIWTASSNKKTFTGFKTPEEAAAKLRNYMHKHTQGYDNTYIPAFEIDNDSDETISYISPIYFGNYIDEEYGYDFSDDEDYFDPEDYEGNDSYSNTKGSTSVNATTKQNTKWSLDSNTGILNISGSGRMDGHISTPDRQYVKSVNIENGITSIRRFAFEDCSNLTSITIPDSVTSIGDCAFYGCSSLTSITIPNSVTRIGSEAFSGCSSPTSIIIPNSATIL